MTDLNALNEIFPTATTLKYRPLGKTLFLEIPLLNSGLFKQLNAILKDASQQSPLTIAIDLKNEKKIVLSIHKHTECIALENLRPIYSLKRKLTQSNPELVELCLYNYQIPGMYIGTKFKLELEA